MPSYEIREFRPEDLPSLLETYEVCFGQPGATRPARTVDEWRYTYEQNPAGWRIFVAVSDGVVVGQYAARPYRVWAEGRERHFAEIVDSMVHPEHRRGLKAPGLFVQIALPFFDAYGGREHPQDLVHYGWPVENAYRIGRLYMRYFMFRTQTALVRDPGEGSAELPSGVEVLDRFDESVDPLYLRCRGAWGASTIRDAAFLNWRFVANPFHDYRLFGVRGADGALRGYVVYRFCDWIVERMGLAVDFLVPWEDREAATLLKDALIAAARADGASVVAVMLPEWSEWYERFQEWGFVVAPTPYYMVGQTFEKGHSLYWIRNRWWYTLADSDLA